MSSMSFFSGYAPDAKIRRPCSHLRTFGPDARIAAGVVLAEARRAASGHDGPGHLVRGLVDHLVAEHDRAAGLYAGGVPVRLDDPRRVREIVRGGREHLVGRDLDLESGCRTHLPS